MNEEKLGRISEVRKNSFIITFEGREIPAKPKGSFCGAELEEVSVKIPHQGKGLGKKFVKYLTNRILEKGEVPVLWCMVGNARARAICDSLGYLETCRDDFAKKKFDGNNTEEKA